MSSLYDYYAPSGKELLIYVGRVPNEDDPGVYVSADTLMTLYQRNLLTGDALQDAGRLYGLSTAAH